MCWVVQSIMGIAIKQLAVLNQEILCKWWCLAEWGRLLCSTRIWSNWSLSIVHGSSSSSPSNKVFGCWLSPFKSHYTTIKWRRKPISTGPFFSDIIVPHRYLPSHQWIIHIAEIHAAYQNWVSWLFCLAFHTVHINSKMRNANGMFLPNFWMFQLSSGSVSETWKYHGIRRKTV